MEPLLKDWEHPKSEEEILQAIGALMEENVPWEGRPEEGKRIFGFPSTTPHPIARIVYDRWIMAHANNIGLHTHTKESEHGFEGTQKAERRVIAMLADLMGTTLDEVDGYIAPGGTEANFVSCWMGRDVYPGGSVALLCSCLTHYSFVKTALALGILRRGEEFVSRSDQSGMHRLGTDEDGHLLIDAFTERLWKVARAGIQNIIVVANGGTTMLGSVDNIPVMGMVIQEVKNRFPDKNIHFHVDAAFGGLVAPFVPGLSPIGFENPAVDTVTIDPYKTGRVPFGIGVLLARRGLFKRIQTEAPYVPGDDSTFCGSRPGIHALVCLAVMEAIGKRGYREAVGSLMALTDQIQERFRTQGIETFQNDINVIGVKSDFPAELQNRYRYIVHVDRKFPFHLHDPLSSDTRTIWNIVVMAHHLVDDAMELFLNRLFAALSKNV